MRKKLTAVGAHVFAGWFTDGVGRVMQVPFQLETHGFGIETAKLYAREVINTPTWEHWPQITGHLLFANPRCSGFSCVTSNCDTGHGPWAPQCKDVHDVCHYGVDNEFDVIIWESVQQAYTTGKPLLDYIVANIYQPRGYRVAHVFINAASFSNVQFRKRYFFVAYRGNNFNIEAPVLPERNTVLGDLVFPDDATGTPCKIYRRDAVYNRDSYLQLTDEEALLLPHLQQDQCLNRWAKANVDTLMSYDVPRHKRMFRTNNQEMPFSMHCIRRLHPMMMSPTLTSSCGHFVHPYLDRPLTVGELSRIMGLRDIPRGFLPVAQIAKGVVPAVGQWLAEQVERFYYAKDKEDWEVSYCDRRGEWVGNAANGALEKVIDLTRYVKAKP